MKNQAELKSVGDWLQKEHQATHIDGGLLNSSCSIIKYKHWELIIDFYTKGFAKETTKNKLYTRVRTPVLTLENLKFNLSRDSRSENNFIIDSNKEARITELLNDDKIKEALYQGLHGSLALNDHKGWLFKEQFPAGKDVLHFECKGILKEKESIDNVISMFKVVLDGLVKIQSIRAEEPNFRPRKTWKRLVQYFVFAAVVGSASFLINVLEEVVEDTNTNTIQEDKIQAKLEAEDNAEWEAKAHKEEVEKRTDHSKSFNISAIHDSGTAFLVNEAQLYPTTEMNSPNNIARAGVQINIVEHVQDYIFDEENKVQLIDHQYKVIFNNDTAYTTGLDLALQEFKIGSTQFLIGVNDSGNNLTLNAFLDGAQIEGITLFNRTYEMNAYETNFDILNFEFETIENEDFKEVSFFQFRVENNGSAGWASSNIYYWNGSNIGKLELTEEKQNVLEYTITFPSDPNGIKDTLIYNTLNGYTDEAGD